MKDDCWVLDTRCSIEEAQYVPVQGGSTPGGGALAGNILHFSIRKSIAKNAKSGKIWREKQKKAY